MMRDFRDKHKTHNPDLFLYWSTGATITDFDGDGLLDLLVAHGESASQPISVFKVNQVRQLSFNKNYTPKYAII